MNNKKTITVHLSEETHKDMKMKVATENISIKNYILYLVRKDIDDK